MHFALLDDDALVVIGLMFQLMECIGCPPKQLSFLLVVLIPKGLGKVGYRPIFLFTALYKTWARARNFWASKLLIANDRSYVACGKYRSPEDVV